MHLGFAQVLHPTHARTQEGRCLFALTLGCTEYNDVLYFPPPLLLSAKPMSLLLRAHTTYRRRGENKFLPHG